MPAPLCYYLFYFLLQNYSWSNWISQWFLVYSFLRNSWLLPYKKTWKLQKQHLKNNLQILRKSFGICQS